MQPAQRGESGAEWGRTIRKERNKVVVVVRRRLTAAGGGEGRGARGARAIIPKSPLSPFHPPDGGDGGRAGYACLTRLISPRTTRRERRRPWREGRGVGGRTGDEDAFHPPSPPFYCEFHPNSREKHTHTSIFFRA